MEPKPGRAEAAVAKKHLRIVLWAHRFAPQKNQNPQRKVKRWSWTINQSKVNFISLLVWINMNRERESWTETERRTVYKWHSRALGQEKEKEQEREREREIMRWSNEEWGCGFTSWERTRSFLELDLQRCNFLFFLFIYLFRIIFKFLFVSKLRFLPFLRGIWSVVGR